MRNMILVSTCLFFLGCQPAPDTHYVSTEMQNIYWSDGDSGRLDGTKFRLANVDAPETGGVGARGGAKCESERALGYSAKAFMVAMTKNAALEITNSYGEDRYGRLVIDLAANGQDVGSQGQLAGHLEPWPHKGRRALQPKPAWCDRSAAPL